MLNVIKAPKAPLLASLLFAPLSFANDLFQMSMKELLAVQVSVASKAIESQKEAAASITVYTREELAMMGISQLDELLNYVPGFISAREESASVNATVVRGRRINSNAPDVLLLLNGIRLNDPVTSGAFYSTSNFSLFNIKQVEIIRGPTSALYGSNAFSAAINLITDESNEVQASLSSFNGRNLQVSFFHSLQNGTLSGYLGHASDDGQRYEPFFSFFGTEQATFDPKYGNDIFLEFSWHKLQLSHRWTERSYQDFIVGGTIGNGHNDFYRSAELTNIKYAFNPLQNIQAAIWADYYQVSQDAKIIFYPGELAASLPLGWTNGSNKDLIGGNVRDADEYRLGTDWSIHMGKHKISTGLEFRNESTGLNAFQSNIDTELLLSSGGTRIEPLESGRTIGFYLPDGTRLDLIQPFDRDIWGLYIQDNWQYSTDTKITLGARYDDYQSISDNLSLRLGVITQLSSSSTVKLLYSEAFRAPTIIDTQAEYSSVEVGNPDLKPELISTWDLVYVYQQENLSISSNFFYSQIDNEIVVELRDIFEGFNSLQPVNKEQKSLSGVELELVADINNNFFLRAGLSFYHSYQKLGAAKWHGYWSAIYQSDNWNLNLNGHMRDRVLSAEAEANTYLDEFHLLNSKFSFKYSPSLTLYMELTNLFDQDYATYSTAAGLEQGLPARGRTWELGLNYNF